VEVMGEVARQLSEVGVRVDVKAVPKETFYRLLDEGTVTFYLFGWAVEYVDAGEALDTLLHSRKEGEAGLGANNYQALADPVLDRLIEESDEISDTRK